MKRAMNRGRRRARVAGLSCLLTVLATVVVALLLMPLQHGAAAPATSSSLSAAKKKKLAQAGKALSEAPEGVVMLSNANFTRSAHTKDRPYTTVVLFTAMAPEFGCSACLKIDKWYTQVARSYKLSGQFETAPHPILFTKVDVGYARQVFGEMKLESAPHVFIFRRGNGYSAPLDMADQIRLGQSMGPETVDLLTRTIKVMTDVEITVQKDSSTQRYLLLLVSGMLGVAMHFIEPSFGTFLAIIRSKMLWMAVTLITYAVGTGGFVYCIIRSPPPFRRVPEPDGKGSRVELFSTQNRDQNLYEGGAVAFLYLVFAAALIGMYVIAGRSLKHCQEGNSSSRSSRSGGGSQNDSSSPAGSGGAQGKDQGGEEEAEEEAEEEGPLGWLRDLLEGLLRKVAILALLVLVIVSIRAYFEVYLMKTGFYSVGEVVPQVVKDLLFAKVKRSSGLGKRLVRVSYVWLNDYKDLSSFADKAKVLLLDYARRRLGLL